MYLFIWVRNCQDGQLGNLETFERGLQPEQWSNDTKQGSNHTKQWIKKGGAYSTIL
jgi:hypothetical protein